MHRIKKHADELPPLPITARRLATHVNENLLPSLVNRLTAAAEAQLATCSDDVERAKISRHLKFLRCESCGSVHARLEPNAAPGSIHTLRRAQQRAG
jgi:hypothetical protein